MKVELSWTTLNQYSRVWDLDEVLASDNLARILDVDVAALTQMDEVDLTNVLGRRVCQLSRDGKDYLQEYSNDSTWVNTDSTDLELTDGFCYE